jgi:putative flippase GtrA
MRMLQIKELKQKFIEFKKTKLYGEFIRYLIAGFSLFALDYTLFWFLADIIKLYHIIAVIIVHCIIFWLGFFVYKFWVFVKRKDTTRQLILYLILFFFNMGAIAGIMYLLTDLGGIHYMFSKIMVMGVVVLWNFTIYRKVIYK